MERDPTNLQKVLSKDRLEYYVCPNNSNTPALGVVEHEFNEAAWR